MSDIISQEIREAIERNLPSHIGDVLSQQLNELKALRSAHEGLKEHAEENLKAIERLKEENAHLNSALGDIEHREHEVKNGEGELAEKAQKLALDQQKCDLIIKHSEEKVALAKEFFEIPFKNRVLRESLHTQVPIRSDYVSTGRWNSQTGQNNEHVVRNDTMQDQDTEHTVEEG